MASRAIATFLTRTAGNPKDKADRFGLADFLAYGYLVFGVLDHSGPGPLDVFQFDQARARHRQFRYTDRCRLHRSTAEVPRAKATRPSWIYTDEDGNEETLVFKAGPTRKETDVAPSR